MFTIVMLVAALPARADGPEATASAKVHDHVAFTFRAPLGARTASQRANEASAGLGAIIDEESPGEVQVVPHGDRADVLGDGRLLFQLSDDDARADGATALADYGPRVQSNLQSFVTKERRRAKLQRGVLGVSLAVFFGVLVWVLLRAFYRATRAFEQRLERGEEILPATVQKLGIVNTRSRGAWLFALSALRIAVTLSAIYVFLLVSLSLFEAARPFRDRLALWAAAPFRALGERLVHGLPNLLLLLVVLAVVRGGWRGITVGFARMAGRDTPGAFAAHQMIPARLIARAVLVVGGLMVLPLVLGSEGGLFDAVGLVLLSVAGLASVPLLANVAVGVYALFTNQYPGGIWLRVGLPTGKELLGEVSSVDFFHVRLVPDGGGELRVPHLLALWSSVENLMSAPVLVVELPVARASMAPQQALEALLASAQRVAATANIKTTPMVELVGVTPSLAQFRVTVPDAMRSLRSPLLLALEEATRTPAEPRAKEQA
ncbi:MAG: mechanosensitive ion channel family protein [Deltaproteobacteria bacterium]|nr:mechanosensitive ion channel family protein [Deltaproteobacteria bacterium]